MRKALLAFPLFFCLAAPALAQETTCHSVAGYNVLEIENVDFVGSRFAVKARAKGAAAACKFKETNADFIVGSEDEPLHFEAINERFLVMTRSTGPQGQVVIYDLKARDTVLDVLANEVEVDRTGATYWERIDEGTAKNCKEFAEYKKDGFGADIAVETRFDFKTLKATASRNRRCDPSQ